jgi:predicted porin
MKKSLIALAALAAVTAASAQSSVTLSGSLSFGYAKAATNAGVETRNIAPVDAFNSNNFTLTATEDLGGGLKATGVIMQRKGDTNTDAITGDMYLDVSGGFGAVRIGQWTWNSLSSYNAFASRSATTLAGTAATGVGGNDTISYTTPAFNGFTASVGYTARPTTTAGETSDGVGIKATYSAGPLSVQVASTRAATAASGDGSTVQSLGATYDLGVAKVFFNTYDQAAGQTLLAENAVGARLDEKGNSISVAVPVGALTLKAGIINRSVNTATTAAASTNPGAIDRVAFGADYALSKRTTLIADFGSQKQAVTGLVKATTFHIGALHTF